MDARTIIDALGMSPHPEGGHFVETWRGAAGADGRGTASAIYFLLRAGERSHWHRIDAAEVWLHHAGEPVLLTVDDGSTRLDITLGGDLAAGERPQAVVPPRAWQSAAPVGEWALVSCVVAPAFSFDGFELAPPGWEPRPA